MEYKPDTLITITGVTSQNTTEAVLAFTALAGLVAAVGTPVTQVTHNGLAKGYVKTTALTGASASTSVAITKADGSVDFVTTEKLRITPRGFDFNTTAASSTVSAAGTGISLYQTNATGVVADIGNDTELVADSDTSNGTSLADISAQAIEAAPRATQLSTNANKAGPSVKYDITAGEIVTTATVASHAGQTAIEPLTTATAAARRFRVSDPGTAGAAGESEITLTHTNGNNTIKVLADTSSGGLIRFKLKQGWNAPGGTYTASVGGAEIIVSDMTAAGMTKPTFISGSKAGVITAITLTTAGTDYTSNNAIASTVVTGSGSGATFGVDGFLSVNALGYDGGGVMQFGAKAYNLPAGRRTALTAGEYEVYQTHVGKTSQSVFANTVSKGYTGLSLHENRRLIYIGGDDGDTTAGSSISVPTTSGTAATSGMGSTSSAFQKIKLGTIDAFTTVTAEVANLEVWSETNIRLTGATASSKITVELSIDGGDLMLNLSHGDQTVHDVNAIRFTVTLREPSAMHATKPIMDAFDVFLHTLNDPFVRTVEAMNKDATQTLALVDPLTWSVWNENVVGGQYNHAKSIQFAKLDFEGGAGTYGATMASDCLRVTHFAGGFMELGMFDPNNTTQQLRTKNNSAVAAPIGRDVAKHLRRLAVEESNTLEFRVGNDDITIAKNATTDIARTGSLSSPGKTGAQIAQVVGTNYYSVTLAGHNYKSGDVARFHTTAGVSTYYPVLYVDGTKFYVYSTTTPAGPMYDDMSLLRIKYTAGSPQLAGLLDLSKCNNKTHDLRMFFNPTPNQSTTLPFQMRANSDGWAKASNCRHAEDLIMVGFQADDRVELGTVTANAGATLVVRNTLHSLAIGNPIELRKAGQTNTTVLVTAVGTGQDARTEFSFVCPAGWGNTGDIAVYAKGAAYASARSTLSMRLVSPPTKVGTPAKASKVYTADLNATLCTQIVDLQARPSQGLMAPDTSAATWDLVKASGMAPPGPIGPIREGALDAYTMTFPLADTTQGLSTDVTTPSVELEQVAMRVKHTGTGTASITYSATPTFAFTTHGDDKTLAATTGEATRITVAEVAKDSLGHHEKAANRVHTWETTRPNQNLLTFGSVGTVTRSLLEFTGVSDTLQRVAMTCVSSSSITIARWTAGTAGYVQQLDANGHVVAEGRIVSSSSTADATTAHNLEVQRTWGVDFVPQNSMYNLRVGGSSGAANLRATKVQASVSFTGSASNNSGTDSHKLTTAGGLAYLDRAVTAGDSVDHPVSVQIRGVEASAHAIGADNTRVITNVVSNVKIIFPGTGYKLADVLTLTSGQTQQITVMEVNNMGGVVRFRLSAAASGNLVVGDATTTAGVSVTGIGFLARITEATPATTYSMDTNGFSNTNAGGTRPFSLNLKNAALDYDNLTVAATGEVVQVGTNIKDMYLMARSTARPLGKLLDTSKASIQAVEGYTYAGVSYMGGTDVTVKAYRSPRFELMDHGTTNVLTTAQGVLMSNDTLDHIQLANGGAGYAPMDILTVAGTSANALTVLVREVGGSAVVPYTGTNAPNRGAITRFEILTGSCGTAQTGVDAVGGTGTGAQFTFAAAWSSLLSSAVLTPATVRAQGHNCQHSGRTGPRGLQFRSRAHASRKRHARPDRQLHKGGGRRDHGGSHQQGVQYDASQSQRQRGL